MANEVVIDIKVASGDAQAKMHDLAESIKKDTLSWTEFLKERMGPAMREYGSHTAAMQALSAEYKQYKSTLGQVGAAQEANTAVVKQAAQAQEGLIGKIRGFGTSLKPLEADLKRMGLAISGFGAVGTAAFALMVKAAQEQQIGIQQLDQALVNIGKSYAGERAAIEGVIEVLQRKTNFGDEAQRKSLQTMITLSGSYEDGLRALPAVLDLAAGKHMGLEEASSLVGRALAGNTERLGLYGIEVARGATATEIITAILAKFQGQAEAAADPITQMKTSIGNASEAMGRVFLPAVNAVAGVIGQLAAIIANLDPRLLTIGVTVGALAVAFASIAGPALLFLGFLPAIVAGFTAIGPLASAAAAGVSGLAASFSALIVSAAPVVAGILAVVAVAAAGAAELVALKNTFDNLIMGTEKETNAWKILKGDIENLVDGARDLMGGFTDLLIPSADIEKILTDMGAAAGGATDNAEGLKTSFSELSPKLLALGYPMEEIFVQAQKLVDELGMELPAALDAVVEAIYPGADKAFKDTINNVLGLNKVLKETRTWTEPASSAYLDLAARMEALGRPMEDLLPLAMRLKEEWGVELPEAINMLAEALDSELNAELQEAIRGFLGLGDEVKKTRTWTEPASSAYLDLAARMEALGRPMEDLLPLAQRLKEEWGVELPEAINMLAEALDSELNAELQEAIREFLGLGNESKKAADAVAESFARMKFEELKSQIGGLEMGPSGERQPELREIRGLQAILGTGFYETLSIQTALRGALGLGAAQAGAMALPLVEILRAVEDLREAILLPSGTPVPLDALIALLKERWEGWELPSFAGGGVVPGGIGQPVPILAHGGEIVSPPALGGQTRAYLDLAARIEAMGRSMEAVLPLSAPRQELPLDALLNLLKNRWEIPALAQGGIVTQPTLAYLGESGREAVFPLSSAQGTFPGGGISVNFYGPVFGERDMEEKVSQIFRDVARRGGFAGVLP